MSRHLGKILLIRLDRIGDLVLTLPVDEALKKIDQKADIKWWIPKGLSFITQSANPVRTVLEIDLNFNWARFQALLADLRAEKPRIAIVFHAPWWISLLLFLARVPVRAGPKSQWHQYLFLNRRLKQKRSNARRHELEYNFQLAEHALKLGSGWLPRGHLHLQSPTTGILDTHSLKPKNYVVVHPGMGGSALNWPLPLYTQLITRLAENTNVVVTGTKADAPFITPIRESLMENPNVVWLNEKANGTELIDILQNASACVAPSTGVLHVAASCGTPTVGLFSPVPVQRATRWGPKGEHVRTLTPEVECPGHFECLGSKCQHFACMQNISVASVQLAIKDLATSQS